VVQRAGARPEVVGRSRSQWESAELARQLGRDGVVAASSPQTVQRMLAHHTLQPWRHHRWRSPQVPRDAACAAQGHAMVTLSPRPWGVGDMVLCVDEQTRRPPRTRKAPTWAAQPGRPVRVAQAYTRTGALHRFAGFETRPGTVDATTAARKHQGECLIFLAPLEREMAPTITTRPIVLDQVRMYKGQHVQAWLSKHPRCLFPCPPVHGSWRNQGEQWCSMVPRQRLQLADCADKHQLAARLLAFVAAWNAHAQPFQWSTKSVAKVMAKGESPLAEAA
jgi:hypothetical protein